MEIRFDHVSGSAATAVVESSNNFYSNSYKGNI